MVQTELKQILPLISFIYFVSCPYHNNMGLKISYDSYRLGPERNVSWLSFLGRGMRPLAHHGHSAIQCLRADAWWVVFFRSDRWPVTGGLLPLCCSLWVSWSLHYLHWIKQNQTRVFFKGEKRESHLNVALNQVHFLVSLSSRPIIQYNKWYSVHNTIHSRSFIGPTPIKNNILVNLSTRTHHTSRYLTNNNI